MTWDLNRLRAIAGTPLTEEIDVTIRDSLAVLQKTLSDHQKELTSHKAKGKFQNEDIVDQIEQDIHDVQALIARKKSKKVTESYDDDGDDDMSPAEKALAAKADKDLKKSGVKLPNVNPDRDMQRLAKSELAAVATKDKVKAEVKAKAETEAKASGTATPTAKKAHQAAAWLAANPGVARGVFIKHATANFGFGNHYASTFFYSHKKKGLKEFWMIGHPSLSSFYLAENREINQYQWVDNSSPLDLMIFETEAEANKTALYMNEWKNQQTVVEHCVV